MAQETNEFQAPVEHRRAVRELMDEKGEAGAAKDIGISRAAMLRVVAGREVRPGTLALLRERFGKAAS